MSKTYTVTLREYDSDECSAKSISQEFIEEMMRDFVGGHSVAVVCKAVEEMMLEITSHKPEPLDPGRLP